MAISTGFRFEKSIRIIFGFMLLTSLLCILPGCASSPSTSDSAKISSVLYTIQPLKVGEFNPIDIKLDLNSDRYVTPKNDGDLIFSDSSYNEVRQDAIIPRALFWRPTAGP